jgi:D-3-phosphoglycerate dehydrogenase
LLRLDNVIVTPHALCWTDECFAGIGASDVAAVLAIKGGKPPTGLVNREVVERLGFQAKLRLLRT